MPNNKRKQAWFYIQHQCHCSDICGNTCNTKKDKKIHSSLKTLLQSPDITRREIGHEVAYYNSETLPEFLNHENEAIRKMSTSLLRAGYDYALDTIVEIDNYKTEEGLDVVCEAINYITGPTLIYSIENIDKNWLKNSAYTLNPVALSQKLLFLAQQNCTSHCPEISADISYRSMLIHQVIPEEEDLFYKKKIQIAKFEQCMLSENTSAPLRLEMAKLYPDIALINDEHHGDIYSPAITTLLSIADNFDNNKYTRNHAKAIADNLTSKKSLRLAM